MSSCSQLEPTLSSHHLSARRRRRLLRGETFSLTLRLRSHKNQGSRDVETYAYQVYTRMLTTCTAALVLAQQIRLVGSFPGNIEI